MVVGMENTSCRRETAKGGEETLSENHRHLPADGRTTRVRSNQETAVFSKQRGFRGRRQPAGAVTYAAYRQLARGHAAPRDRRVAANSLGYDTGTDLGVFLLSRTDPLR